MLKHIYSFLLGAGIIGSTVGMIILAATYLYIFIGILVAGASWLIGYAILDELE